MTDQYLTTGWEPDAPADDTIARQWALHFAAFNAWVGVALSGRLLQSDRFVAVDLGRPAGFFNCAVLTGSMASADDPMLEEIESFYTSSSDRDAGRRGAEAGTVTLFSPLPTPDLRPRGWQLWGHPPFMYRPVGGQLPPDRAGFTIEPVREVRQVETFERVLVDGYPMPELQSDEAEALFTEAVLDDERFGAWIGYEGDDPVAVGAAFVENWLVGVQLIATLDAALGSWLR